MQRKQYSCEFARWVLDQSWFEGASLSLIDVGASGGIDSFWRQFQPHLHAVGFDPLLAEVERLNATESDPKIRYEAGWVGDGTMRGYPPGTLYPFPSSSASEAAQISRKDYIETHFNSGQEVVYSDRCLSLDQFVEDRNDIDALKIDTDSFDYFVLKGATKLLTEGRILMVECECQLHEIRPGWPNFADIDKFMRDAGYRLVDLDPWRYTRAVLPGRFLHDIHAQTEDGQAHFCDALYTLDPALDDAALERLRPDPAKFAKLALLQAAFGYPDLAAATLVKMRKVRVLPEQAIDAALDRLVPGNPYGATTYREYLNLFTSDPDNFLASRWQAASHKPMEEAAEQIAAIDLGRLSVIPSWEQAGAKLEVGRTGAKVRTADAAWQYSALAPIGRLPAVPGGSHLFLRVHISGVEGKPMLSLFDWRANTIHNEVMPLPNWRSQAIDFLLDSNAVDAPNHFLIRNGDNNRASELIVEKIEIVAIQPLHGW